MTKLLDCTIAPMPKAKPFTSDPSEVSARMRLIRGKNTRAELALFSILSEAGIPFDPHVRIGRMQADARVYENLLLFVDSPFWHLRDRDELSRLSSYWRQRLLRNRRRDERQRRILRRLGFSVVRFWADEVSRPRVLCRIERVLKSKRNGGT